MNAKPGNKKLAALKMRSALVKVGASEAVIAAALAQINPKDHPAVKVTKELKARIILLLDKPGARCVLVRNRGGVRAYLPSTLEKFSAGTKEKKPWLKAKAAKDAAKAGTTAS